MPTNLQIKNIKQAQHPFHVLNSSKLTLNTCRTRRVSNTALKPAFTATNSFGCLKINYLKSQRRYVYPPGTPMAAAAAAKLIAAAKTGGAKAMIFAGAGVYGAISESMRQKRVAAYKSFRDSHAGSPGETFNGGGQGFLGSPLEDFNADAAATDALISSVLHLITIYSIVAAIAFTLLHVLYKNRHLRWVNWLLNHWEFNQLYLACNYRAIYPAPMLFQDPWAVLPPTPEKVIHLGPGGNSSCSALVPYKPINTPASRVQ